MIPKERKFQEVRQVDQQREICCTNTYTAAKLFPDENPVDALRRELRTLTVKEYMRTVKELRFPKRSEMREFGKVYNGREDVAILDEIIRIFGGCTKDAIINAMHKEAAYEKTALRAVISFQHARELSIQ